MVAWWHGGWFGLVVGKYSIICSIHSFRNRIESNRIESNHSLFHDLICKIKTIHKHIVCIEFEFEFEFEIESYQYIHGRDTMTMTE